jgi:hypothetical protein
MREVAVFVQTCPARRVGARETLESVRASDIGEDFSVLEHPSDQTKCQFFESVLRQMSAADAPYVMRLEDDVIVNRHILHNFLTWPALKNPLFGAGWLYVSEAAFRATRTHRMGYRNTEVMYGSLCVGMPREHVAAAVQLLEEWQKLFGCALDTCNCGKRNDRPRMSKTYGQDCALSRAVWKLGKRVFFHDPVLAENRLIQSTHGLKTTGHPSHWRAGKLFQVQWRRSPNAIEEESFSAPLKVEPPRKFRVSPRHKKRIKLRPEDAPKQKIRRRTTSAARASRRFRRP